MPTLVLAAACGAPSTEATSWRSADPPSAAPAHPSPSAPADPVSPEPAPAAPAWLRALLAWDWTLPRDEDRVQALLQEMGAERECPTPGRCFGRLELAGHTAQVHVEFEPTGSIQIWGPTDYEAMPAWVAAVEALVDASLPNASAEAAGTRPDRAWRTTTTEVVLHDHSEMPCGGFCPASLHLSPIAGPAQ